MSKKYPITTKAMMIKEIWGEVATPTIIKKLSRKYTYNQLFAEYVDVKLRARLMG